MTPWNWAFTEWVRTPDVDLPTGYISGNIRKTFPKKACAVLLTGVVPIVMSIFGATWGLLLLGGTGLASADSAGLPQAGQSQRVLNALDYMIDCTTLHPPHHDLAADFLADHPAQKVWLIVTHLAGFALACMSLAWVTGSAVLRFWYLCDPRLGSLRRWAFGLGFVHLGLLALQVVHGVLFFAFSEFAQGAVDPNSWLVPIGNHLGSIVLARMHSGGGVIWLASERLWKETILLIMTRMSSFLFTGLYVAWAREVPVSAIMDGLFPQREAKLQKTYAQKIVEDGNLMIVANYDAKLVSPKNVVQDCSTFIERMELIFQSLRQQVGLEKNSFSKRAPHLLGILSELPKLCITIDPEVSESTTETTPPNLSVFDFNPDGLFKIVAPSIAAAEEEFLGLFVLSDPSLRKSTAFRGHSWLSLGIQGFLETSLSEQIAFGQTISFSHELLSSTEPATVAAAALKYLVDPSKVNL